MLIFLNGKFVPEEQAVVSVFDRGFLYGDGLFETMRISNGKPFRWVQHLERLRRGAEFLKIKLPFTPDELRHFADQLIAINSVTEALLRVTLSRGVGERGYSPKGADHATIVMSHQPVPPLDLINPPQWKLAISSLRLGVADSLSQYKTANKLAQVLARSYADDVGADEALLLSSDGRVAEATAANLFWVDHGAICTTPPTVGILPGVTRAVVMEICERIGLTFRQADISSEQLRKAEGIFLTQSSLGVVEVVSYDGQPVKQSPLVNYLRLIYHELVGAETA